MENDRHIQSCPWNVRPISRMPISKFIMKALAARGDDSVVMIDGVTGEEVNTKQLVNMIKYLSYGWSRSGLQRGDVVCVISPNCIEYPVTILAVIAARAVATLANPLYTEEELRRQILDSKSTWVVAHPSVLDKVVAAARGISRIKGIFSMSRIPSPPHQPRHLCGFARQPPKEWDVGSHEPDEVVLLPYSSGTTGLPKGVQLTSQNVVSVVDMLDHPNFMQISRGETAMCLLPMYHVFAIGVTLGALVQGGTLIILPGFTPETFIESIRKYKINFLPLVPPLILFLVKDSRMQDIDLSHTKSIMSGAAPLSAEVERMVLKMIPGVQVRQGYGMTETTVATHVSRANCGKEGTIGTCIPHVQAKVIHLETSKTLGPNEDGEICVRGPNIMKGYFSNTEATSATFDSAGWLLTGDIGHYDEDGDFFIVDRKKELIKYKGFQVAPAELEGILLGNEAIADVAVVGVQDLEAGELPRAYVVLQEGANTSNTDIVTWIQARVAPHKRLRGGVEFCNEIPKSPTGKILRRLLRDEANKKRKLVPKSKM